MSVGSLGISSGMDINSMVSAIVNSERAPKQARIDNERMDIGVNISAYGRLRESLDTMKNLMANFRQEKAFAARSVESTNDDVVSATATTNAIAGRYAIDVLQLAQSHKVASEAMSDETRFGPGKLHISLDSHNFTVDVKDRARIMDVVQGINAESGSSGVRASIINDANGQRLIVASDRSGADYSIKITAESELGNSLEKLEYNAAEKDRLESTQGQDVASQDSGSYGGMVEIQAAQDSVIVLDGIAQLGSDNNVIENAIDGIDITVKEVTDPTKPKPEIQVEYDRQSVKSDIEQFVNAYNQFHQISEDLSAVDPQTGVAGPLAGDSIVRSAQARLLSAFSSQIENAPEDLKTLTEFGITSTRQGNLEINSTILDRQLTNNFTKLGEFFGGNQGFAKKVEDAIQSLTGVTGSIRTREDSLREQNYRLNDQQASLDRRMTGFEERTKNKFMSMQDATAKMQGQLSGMMNGLGN